MKSRWNSHSSFVLLALYRCKKKYDTRFIAEAIGKYTVKKNISIWTVQMSFYWQNFRSMKKYDTRFIAELIGKYPAKKKRISIWTAQMSFYWLWQFSLYKEIWHQTDRWGNRKIPSKKIIPIETAYISSFSLIIELSEYHV